MSLSSRKYMSKRQRPCDFCRSRKTACRIEGGLPCRLCTLHGRQCTFVEAARSRKHVSSSTEGNSLASSVAQRPSDQGSNPAISPASQNAVSSPNEINSWQQDHAGRVDAPDMGIATDYLANQAFTAFGDTLPDAEYSPNFPVFDEGLSSNPLVSRPDAQGSTSWLNSQSIEIQLDTIDGLHPQILGYSGDMDPYLLQNYQYDVLGAFQFKQLSIHSVCQSIVPTQFLLSQPGLFAPSRQEAGLDQPSFDSARRKLETVVPRDTGFRLIGLFRRFILPQYPIFSEQLFPDPQISPPHLLAAIYMVAQPFARFDDVLSIELAYENLNSQVLLQTIHDALRYDAYNPNIATVQTLLLVIIRPSTNALVLESSYKWSLHGTLVSTSHTLGLHYDPASWSVARWQIALRRRLSSTIFAVDKWLAASLGRPPLIKQDNWLVISLADEDGHSSALNSVIWSAHLRYSKLGSIMGEALSGLFSLRAVSKLASNIEATFSVAEPLLKELADWHQSFVTHSGEDPTEDPSLPIVCTLGYHYLQMTIFRAVMRPFLANLQQNAVSPDMTGPDQSDRADLLGFARRGVRSSTTAAAAFAKNLREDHSQMFWPHWSQVAFSSICFLDLVMAMSSLDTEEALGWFQELHVARREIRLKSAMLPVLRLGLLRIDAIFWKGIDKVLHLLPHVQEALEASLESGKVNGRP